MVELARPVLLFLLPALGAWGIWIFRKKDPAIPLFLGGASGKAEPGVRRTPSSALLRLGAMALLVVALAGPRTRRPRALPPEEGLAIMVALDLSGSMTQRDGGGPSRLDMAREEVGRFIRARSQDRIGLVTFGEQALTRVPPTADHDHLLDVLDGLEVGSRDEGTALGIGLGLAAHGTLNVPSPTRIVLVLTDGRSNRGQVEPLSAAEAARALGVRIHAVGVGHQGGDDPLDEALLKRIVGIGGGRFFRAEDARGLRDVLSELNTLETGPVAQRAGFVYETQHVGILVLALLLLAAEAGLGLRSRGGTS